MVEITVGSTWNVSEINDDIVRDANTPALNPDVWFLDVVMKGVQWFTDGYGDEWENGVGS
jgi:hypothetical protein